MTSADTPALLAALERILRRTEEAQQELDRLDAVAGDGDAGVTMVLGWRTVLTDLASDPPTTPGAVLRRAAESFASVGGSAGPLWGTALLRAGRALDDAPKVGAREAAHAATAAAAGMCERGRCAEGAKTVVDVMAPAARALETSAATGAGLGESLAAAAQAAATAAQATAELAPQRGRAARAPDRSVGHVDPGAAAGSVFWSALAEC